MKLLSKFEYQVTLAYLLVGGLWILLSDRFLHFLFDDPHLLTSLQTAKGWFYVLATAILLCIFLRRHLQALRDAEKKALEGDRLKTAFLANMSHEIRTPMNGILGFSKILQDDDITPEERTRYLEIIEKSAMRVMGTINDLIDISKIEAGQISLRPADTDIPLVLEELLLFFTPEAEAKGLRLYLSPPAPERPFLFRTDKEKLFAILVNLVKNAIKYSDRGAIAVGCSLDGSLLCFSVRDTGIGIPSNRLSQIFERFIQANEGSSRSVEGSGLGLAIVKAYVALLGGTIGVESEVGKGSHFFFSVAPLP